MCVCVCVCVRADFRFPIFLCLMEHFLCVCISVYVHVCMFVCVRASEHGLDMSYLRSALIFMLTVANTGVFLQLAADVSEAMSMLLLKPNNTPLVTAAMMDAGH